MPPWWALALGSLAPTAFAQSSVDAHGLAVGDLGPQLLRPVVTPWSAPVDPRSGWFGAAIDYSDRSWVDASGAVLLDDLSSLSLAGGFAPVGFLRATAALPFHLGSIDRAGESQPASLGDARLALHPVALSAGQTHLGGVVAASLPTGPADRLLGRGGVGVDLLATLSWTPERAQLSLAFGPGVRPAVTVGGGPIPATALLGHLAGAFQPLDELALGAELRFDAPLSGPSRQALGTVIEALGTARVATGRGVALTFGVGSAPLRAAASPVTRLFFGLGWGPVDEDVVVEPVVVVPEPAEPEPLSVQPDEAEAWLPHPICQWVPWSQAAERLKHLPAATPILLRAPGHRAAWSTLDSGAVVLEVANPSGGLAVVAGEGDRVWVDGEALLPAEDGSWVVAAAVGAHTVEVEGAGRRWSGEAAAVDGWGVWLRAPEVEPVGVLFGVGSYQVDRQAEDALRRLAQAPGDWVYELRGSFSPEGELRDNRTLAAQRAAEVAVRLRNMGLPGRQILVVAPAMPDPGLSPQEQRRVDVVPTGRVR